MAKQIDLSALKKQPVKKKTTPKVDQVVEAIHRAAPEPEPEEEEISKEPLKRITLDLPASLHTRLKLRTVHEETTIRNFVINILEQVLD